MAPELESIKKLRAVVEKSAENVDPFQVALDDFQLCRAGLERRLMTSEEVGDYVRRFVEIAATDARAGRYFYRDWYTLIRDHSTRLEGEFGAGWKQFIRVHEPGLDRLNQTFSYLEQVSDDDGREMVEQAMQTTEEVEMSESEVFVPMMTYGEVLKGVAYERRMQHVLLSVGRRAEQLGFEEIAKMVYELMMGDLDEGWEVMINQTRVKSRLVFMTNTNMLTKEEKREMVKKVLVANQMQEVRSTVIADQIQDGLYLGCMKVLLEIGDVGLALELMNLIRERENWESGLELVLSRKGSDDNEEELSKLARVRSNEYAGVEHKQDGKQDERISLAWYQEKSWMKMLWAWVGGRIRLAKREDVYALDEPEVVEAVDRGYVDHRLNELAREAWRLAPEAKVRTQIVDRALVLVEGYEKGTLKGPLAVSEYKSALIGLVYLGGEDE